jgi:Uma2 family endonuclease
MASIPNEHTSPSQPGEPPWEIALLFPTQGNWSEEEYLALHTNRMVELARGCLEVLPMPTILHQLIVQFLYEQLKSFVKDGVGGLVLVAPCPVKLFDGTYREPDIVYLAADREVDRKQYPIGADLVVEVVSEGPEARKRDLKTKRDEYAQAGIAEYWIVEPESKNLTVLGLRGDEYQVADEAGIDGSVESQLLSGFKVSVREMFDAAEA